MACGSQFFPSTNASPENGVQVVRLGGKLPHPLSHPQGLKINTKLMFDVC